MTDGRRLGRMLVACVAEHDLTRPSPELPPLVVGEDLAPLLPRAAYHGVDGFVYLALRALDGDGHGEVLDELQRRHAHALRQQLLGLVDLAFLASTLDAAGIPWLVFKGPVLAETVYRRADLRSYHDLDILVPRVDFGHAVEALESAGSVLLDRNWELLRRMELGQVHVQLRHGTLADVHWHVLNRRSMRRSLSIPVEDLFDRARTVTIGGMAVKTFDPVDTIIHLCVHAAMAGGVRLLWLKDIERAVSGESIDWAELVARAREWKAAVPVGAMLQRSRTVLGAAVPDDVVAELASRPARALNLAVDKLWPPQAAIGNRSPSGPWMQYRRDRFATTAFLVARRLRSRWPGRQARSPAGEDDDWSEVLPVFRPAGGPECRAAFFAGVTGDRPFGDRP